MTIAALAVLAPSAGATRTATVKPPPSGSQYSGTPGKMQLGITGRAIGIMAFGFRCGRTRGRTSLNSIRLTRSSTGYRFALRAHGNVSFDDGSPDENAAIRVRGRFSSTARTVRGVFRVSSRRCHTGDVRWTAHG